MMTFANDWHKVRSPSHTLWSMKRPAADTLDSKPQQDEAADVFEPTSGEFKTLEKMTEECGAPIIVAGKKPFYQVAMFPNGRCALVSKEPGVVPAAEPLVLVKGRFLAGNPATKAEDDSNTNIFLPWSGVWKLLNPTRPVS